MFPTLSWSPYMGKNISFSFLLTILKKVKKNEKEMFFPM